MDHVPFKYALKGIGPALADTLSAFYQRIVQHQALPLLSSEQSTQDPTQLTVSYTERPTKLILWKANNPITRDFRYACDIRYQATPLAIEDKQVTVALNPASEGWTAAYVQAEFADGLLQSTPIFIFPKDKYPTPEQIMPQKGACLVLDSFD